MTAVALLLILLVAASASLASVHDPQADSAEPRTIAFSGYTWDVKSSAGAVGPGPNYFSASTGNVWVDKAGRLHLKIRYTNGRWRSAEIVSRRSFGHGTYSWALDSPVYATALDPNAVLGLFTWSDDPAYHNREIDIEFARWGVVDEPVSGMYSVQPYAHAGNVRRFIQPRVSASTHSFTWRPASVLFKNSVAPNRSWTYSGPDVPAAGGEHARMNLWLVNGKAPRNGKAIEVIVKRFTFTPLAG